MWSYIISVIICHICDHISYLSYMYTSYYIAHIVCTYCTYYMYVHISYCICTYCTYYMYTSYYITSYLSLYVMLCDHMSYMWSYVLYMTYIMWSQILHCRGNAPIWGRYITANHTISLQNHHILGLLTADECVDVWWCVVMCGDVDWSINSWSLQSYVIANMSLIIYRRATSNWNNSQLRHPFANLSPDSESVAQALLISAPNSSKQPQNFEIVFFRNPG